MENSRNFFFIIFVIIYFFSSKKEEKCSSFIEPNVIEILSNLLYEKLSFWSTFYNFFEEFYKSITYLFPGKYFPIRCYVVYDIGTQMLISKPLDSL